MTLSTSAYRSGCNWYGTDDDVVPQDLILLGELGEFEIAEGEPDPRGWTIVGCDGRSIGTLEELLVSPSTRKAHLAVVTCGGRMDGKRLAMPLARVRFEPEDRRAFAPYTHESFCGAPEHQVMGSPRGLGYWAGLDARRPIEIGTR